jgi:N-acetylmuramoyl-L-alanine amidase
LNILPRKWLRVCVVACLAAGVSLHGGLATRGEAQPTGAPYTVLSRDGRQALAARAISGQEMFALDDLARLFDLVVREDTLAGGLTIATKGQTIMLSPGQGLASVGGRLLSLPAAPVRDGQRWFVPVDFVPRALAPASGTRMELRKPSRLVLVGDIRVPRVAGSIDALGALAKLTLDVAPAAAHTVTQEGNRLLVRFEADALDATLPSAPPGELITAVRPGESPAVIVVDLGSRFGSYRASDQPGDRGAVRIVIDILAPTTAAGPTTSPPAPAPPDPPPLLDLPPAGGLRTIVVDAGHGGEEEGARGPTGTLEKEVTLSVARRLNAALEARLGVRVILTREADQTVGLDERAALANNNKADLFVSLHANASVRAAAAGAEVFYLSLEEYGDQAQRVARGESEALPVFGGGTRDIEVILWEMAQARYIEQSATLAKLVESTLRERVPMSPRAIQQAPFRVLVGANMPAVLVEMGFITNPEQERQLRSEPFQVSLVQALVDSVVRYRDATARSSGATVPAGRPGGNLSELRPPSEPSRADSRR